MATQKNVSQEAVKLLEKHLFDLGQLSRVLPNLKKKGRANFTQPMLRSKKKLLDQEWENVKINHARLMTIFPAKVSRRSTISPPTGRRGGGGRDSRLHHGGGGQATTPGRKLKLISQNSNFWNNDYRNFAEMSTRGHISRTYLTPYLITSS